MFKSLKKVTLAPFIYQTPSLRQTSLWILFVFSIQLLMLVITKSYNSLIIIAACTIASVLSEILDNFIRRRSWKFDITALIHGIIAGMFLPSTLPPLNAFFIMLLSALIAKYAFGGIGLAWVNAAALTVVIAYITSPAYFPPFLIKADNVTPNIVEKLIADGRLTVSPFDSKISSYLNSNILKYAGISLPEGYISIFWDSGSVFPAFRFNAITLLSSIILFAGNMITAMIPCLYIGVYAILVRLFVLVPFGGSFAQGDILTALMTSGTLFTAFFLIQEYGMTPLSFRGKLTYGVLSGFIAFLLSGCGTSSVGSVFTVLIMNIISPIIQYIEDYIYTSWLNASIVIKRKNHQNEAL